MGGGERFLGFLALVVWMNITTLRPRLICHLEPVGRAFARAGFSRRIAEAVLACADGEAAEALARDGLG